MNILEAILATIGAYFSLVFVLGCICALYSTIVGHRHERRGGLLDLTPSPDSRKNARNVSLEILPREGVTLTLHWGQGGDCHSITWSPNAGTADQRVAEAALAEMGRIHPLDRGKVA